MQSIGELHDDHTEILDHGDEHLTEALDRPLFTSIFDRRELRESLTYEPDFTPKFLLYGLPIIVCILYDIMEYT